MINGSAFEISADRNPHNNRTFSVAIRTPACYRELVSDLVKRRENVVEKLNLNHRFQVAKSHTDRTANDIRLG